MKHSLLIMLMAGLCAVTGLAHAQADDSIQSDSYIVSQEFVEGEVIRVRTALRKITIRGEKRGETRDFTVPEGTRITIEGRQARLRDIRRGDRILVAFQPREERVVVSRIRVPQTPEPLEQRQANPVLEESMPAMLPKTASAWPMILLFGVLLFIAAAAVRLARSRARVQRMSRQRG